MLKQIQKNGMQEDKANRAELLPDGSVGDSSVGF